MIKLVSSLLFAVALSSTSQLHAGEKSEVEFLNSGVIFPKSSNMPFSEGVRVGNTYHFSGMVGLTPGTMTLVKGGIKAESKQTLSNIKAVLEANDLSMKNIVKCTIMLADIGEWSTFNDVYTGFFSAPFPARSAFGVSGLALDARVEMECMAVDF